MKHLLLLTIFIAASLLGAACNTQPTPVAIQPTPPANTEFAELPPDELDDPWAKDNFDLQRVGPLLERSNNLQEFEGYLNDEDGINNLDLNDDGYADYISVREFDDRNDGQRGLSLFSQFGPGLIQEIASIFFYRDQPNYPGSRVLLYGNDQIYGDNNYYETNWLDRSVDIVNFLFDDRDDYYRSPYYYDNYPPDYVAYEVVDTPYYRTRIERLYPEPYFVYTAAAPVYYQKIKIKSPNNGLHLGQIKARLVKPTKEQAEFRKNNPGRGPKNKADKGDKADGPGRSENAPGQQKQAKQPAEPNRGNPNKPDEAGKGGGPPQKADNPGKGQDKGQGQDKGKGGGQGKGKGKP